MPLIQVNVIKDAFTPAQKVEIIARLTDAMVGVEGETMRPVTWCVIHEVASGDWGIAATPSPRPTSTHSPPGPADRLPLGRPQTIPLRAA